MKRKILLLLMFVVVSNAVLNAQIPQAPGNVPSPQAWNFTQYGKMPISHFTGLPSVGITLDIIKENGLTLPIGINYNLGNVRPDIHPGATGLGWNLSLGGVVSRKVRGLIDEFDFTQYNNYLQLGEDTFRYFNGYRNISNPAVNLTSSSIMQTTRPFICDGTVGQCGNNPLFNHLNPIPQILPFLWDNVTYYQLGCPNGCDFYWFAKSTAPTSFSDWNNSGILDNQPDEFTFNVMGLSGKFYLPRGNTNNVTDIICDRKVKITVSSIDENKAIPSELNDPQYNGPSNTGDDFFYNMSPWQRYNAYPKTIWSFIITDEEGNSYHFGKSAVDIDYGNIVIPNPDKEAIEYSIDVYNINHDYWTADAWHLTRIELANGKKISYDYERGAFQTNMMLSAYDSNVEDSSTSANFSVVGREGRLIYPSRLRRVHAEGFDLFLDYSNSNQLRYGRGNSNFYYGKPLLPGFLPNTISEYTNPSDLQWPQLDRIRLNKYDQDTVYYNFSYSSDTLHRLFLNQVAENNGSSDNAVYKFTYNTDSLPEYLTGQTDHWGYWNGKSPTSSDPYIFYNEKQPDTAYLYSGTLKQIQYPTGGVTRFTYEPNEYAKIVKPVRTDTPDSAANAYGGGLRIRKIADYDSIHTMPYNVKEYFYKRGFDNALNTGQVQALASSGILNMKPQYRWKGKSVYYKPNGNTTDSTLFNVQSSQPLYYMTDDYQIGYSEVVEKNNDKSYTIFKFSNHDNGFKDEPYVDVLNNVFNSPFTKYTDKSFERGKLLEKADYDSNNIIVAKRVVSYTVSDTSKPFITLYETNFFNNGSYGSRPILTYNKSVMFGTQFKNYKYWCVPASEQNYIYQNGQNPLITQTKYFYENPLHGRVSRQVVVDSRGDTLTTLYKYAKDYTGEFMLTTIGDRRPGTILETIYMKKNSGGVQKIIGGQVNEYALRTGASGEMPWLNSVYKLQLAEPIDSATDFTHTIPITRDFNSGFLYTKDSRYKEVMKFNNYDAYYNPQEVITQTGQRTIAVRGGQNSLVIATVNPPVAEVAYHLWGYTSFEKYKYRNSEGEDRDERDGDKNFQYSGSFTDTISFSGKTSFVGTVQSKDYVHSCDIYVTAKHGGNAPIYQYLQGTVQTGTAFTKIGEKGGWDIYKVSHSNGGTKIIVNSNSNNIDEIRILANNSKASMQTYCYDKGQIITSVDNNFGRSFYEYDEYGRLKIIRDEDGNILKRVDYKYKGAYQD